MNECGVCKSKIKSLLYCNGCFQRAKSVAERRGRVEELKRFRKVLKSKYHTNRDIEILKIEWDKGFASSTQTNLKYIEKRLLELEKGEIVNG
jgi:hypothetical protein